MASKEPETLRSKMAPVPGIMFHVPIQGLLYLLGHLRLGNPEPNIYLGGATPFQEGLAGRGQFKFIHKKERRCEGAQDILKSKLPTELKLKVNVFLHCEPSLIHSK